MHIKKVEYDAAYCVTCQMGNCIAIRPQLKKLDKEFRVEWEDTGKGMSCNATELFLDAKTASDGNPFPDTIPKKITIKREISAGIEEEITLEFLTLQIFKEKLLSSVIGKKNINFKNDEDIQKYYLETNFYT